MPAFTVTELVLIQQLFKYKLSSEGPQYFFCVFRFSSSAHSVFIVIYTIYIFFPQTDLIVTCSGAIEGSVRFLYFFLKYRFYKLFFYCVKKRKKTNVPFDVRDGKRFCFKSTCFCFFLNYKSGGPEVCDKLGRQ